MTEILPVTGTGPVAHGRGADSQVADAVMMIRPADFGANPLTAPSNAFQAGQTPDGPVSERARSEFAGLADTLRAAGISVIVFDDTREPHTPDAVFPNNWISTHADGTVVLYPMLAENRRTERRTDLVERLQDQHGFTVRKVLDLSAYEDAGQMLEGTGSLVLDRVARVAYACVSPRTHAALVHEFCRRLDYSPVLFHSVDRHGQAIYHTNVMMNVGSRSAVVCADTVHDDAERRALLDALCATHEVVLIGMHQLERFAGNMLELRSRDGAAVLAMSQRAMESLDPGQRTLLERHATIVSAAIDTIEDCGGGSVRCMLAEIHLPRGAA